MAQRHFRPQIRRPERFVEMFAADQQGAAAMLRSGRHDHVAAVDTIMIERFGDVTRLPARFEDREPELIIPEDRHILEAADRLDRRPPHHRHRVDEILVDEHRRIGRVAAEDRTRHGPEVGPIGRPDLPGPVAIGIGEPERLIPFEGRRQGVQEARHQGIIGVDEGDQLARGDGDPVIVAVASVAEIDPLVAHTEPGVGGGDGRGVISAGVVDDHDLIGRAALRQHALHTFAQIAPVIMTGNDDANGQPRPPPLIARAARRGTAARLYPAARALTRRPRGVALGGGRIIIDPLIIRTFRGSR